MPAPAGESPMRLASFIRSQAPRIVVEWENFARNLMPAAEGMTPLALRDHIKDILTFVADDIESSQSKDEQVRKSRGEKLPDPAQDSAAETHASLRQAGGFNMNQMVSEYRALRASVIKLWSEDTRDATSTDFDDLTRFNEAIDQALTVSIRHYSEKLEAARHILLGILGHDLRNPIGASNMCAQLLLKTGALNDRQTTYIEHIVESTNRAIEIVTTLLDITSARLGSGLPVVKEKMDVGFVCKQVMEEMRALYPNRVFTLDLSGKLEGEWDKPRMGQVFSNLVGNAAQYAFSDSPVAVVLDGKDNELVLSVHNDGRPIAAHAMEKIFGSFTRGDLAPRIDGPGHANLGLGLYIVREIVEAHGGAIAVASSEKEGTTFTARFPRLPNPAQ